MEKNGRLHVPTALHLGKKLPIPIGWDAVSGVYKEEKTLAPAGNRTELLDCLLTLSGLSKPKSHCDLTVTVLFFWGALSDERTSLSFVYATGPRQRSLSRVRVPWDS
jgi:hypothetical protein